jgi:hypothetical protein
MWGVGLSCKNPFPSAKRSTPPVEKENNNPKNKNTYKLRIEKKQQRKCGAHK